MNFSGAAKYDQANQPPWHVPASHVTVCHYRFLLPTPSTTTTATPYTTSKPSCMPYYARDTSEDRFSRSSGPFAPSRTPGMRSYFRPGSSSRGSEGSSSSSSSTLPSPLSHSSFSNRYSRPLPRTFEHDAFETNVAGESHIRQTNGTNVNAVESGKLIDHADISSRKMYARERSRYEFEMRHAPSSMYTDPAIYHQVSQVSHDYDPTARSPYSSTPQHYKRLRYTQPSLSTPPPSSPHEHQRTSRHREQYSVDMQTDEMRMDGPCEISE